MRGSLPISIAAMALAFSSAPARAQCGGVCLYENTSPDMGRAAAGAGARAQDASTVFWNPAGMTELGEGHEVMFGLGASFADLNPELEDSTVTPTPPPVSGSNTGGFAPMLGSFLSTRLPFGIRFGMATILPYAGSVDYSNTWTGRGYLTDAELLGLMIQPSLAYAVTDWLSVGGGAAVLYTSFEERARATQDVLAPTIKIADAEDWSAGGVFSVLVKPGALLEPLEGTRVGVTYRTQIVANTNGHIDGPLGLNPVFNGKFTFPQGVNVSLFQPVCEGWAVLADAGWSDWSEFSNIPLVVGPVGGVQERGWHDTWRVGLGLQFVPTEKLTLQGGFGYDSSPVDADRLLPDIPAWQQFRFSAGLMFRPQSYLELSLSYTLLWFGDIQMNNVALPGPAGVVLDGEYKNANVNLVALSMRVKF
jgi:long-chain fatty acid transport protein